MIEELGKPATTSKAYKEIQEKRHCLLFHAVVQVTSVFCTYSNELQGVCSLVHQGASTEHLSWAERAAQGKNKRGTGHAAGCDSPTTNHHVWPEHPDRPRTTSLPGEKLSRQNPFFWFSQKANQSLASNSCFCRLKIKASLKQPGGCCWMQHHPGVHQQPVLSSCPLASPSPLRHTPNISL